MVRNSDPKVLFFLDQDCCPGVGACRPLALLAAALTNHVDLLAAVSGQEVDTGVLTRDWFGAVKTVEFAFGAGPGVLSSKALVQLQFILERTDINVIHCSGYRQVILATLACRLSHRRRSIIVTEHNSHAWRGLGRVKRIASLFATRPDVIVLAKEMLQVMPGSRALARSITHISNGVDTSLFTHFGRERRGGRVRILYPARLTPLKGHVSIIKAISCLVDRQCDVELRLAGDGPLLQELQFVVDREGLKDRVVFLGRVSPEALASEMARADIGVYPSCSEMMPYAVLEMMASGLPVVASRVGGIPDAIRDNVSGYLVDPSDVGGFVHRLEFLVSNSEAALLVGKAAAATVRARYSIAHVAEEIAALYRRLHIRECEDIASNF